MDHDTITNLLGFNSTECHAEDRFWAFDHSPGGNLYATSAEARRHPLFRLFIRMIVFEGTSLEGLIVSNYYNEQDEGVRCYLSKEEFDAWDMKASRDLAVECYRIHIHGNIKIWACSDGSRKDGKGTHGLRRVAWGVWLGAPAAPSLDAHNYHNQLAGALSSECDIDDAELTAVYHLLVHGVEQARLLPSEDLREQWGIGDMMDCEPALIAIEKAWRSDNLDYLQSESNAYLIEAITHLRILLLVKYNCIVHFIRISGHGGLGPMMTADAIAKAALDFTPAEPTDLPAIRSTVRIEFKNGFGTPWETDQWSALAAGGGRIFNTIRSRANRVELYRLIEKRYVEHGSVSDETRTPALNYHFLHLPTSQPRCWTKVLDLFMKGSHAKGVTTIGHINTIGMALLLRADNEISNEWYSCPICKSIVKYDARHELTECLDAETGRGGLNKAGKTAVISHLNEIMKMLAAGFKEDTTDGTPSDLETAIARTIEMLSADHGYSRVALNAAATGLRRLQKSHNPSHPATAAAIASAQIIVDDLNMKNELETAQWRVARNVLSAMLPNPNKNTLALIKENNEEAKKRDKGEFYCERMIVGFLANAAAVCAQAINEGITRRTAHSSATERKNHLAKYNVGKDDEESQTPTTGNDRAANYEARVDKRNAAKASELAFTNEKKKGSRSREQLVQMSGFHIRRAETRLHDLQPVQVPLDRFYHPPAANVWIPPAPRRLSNATPPQPPPPRPPPPLPPHPPPAPPLALLTVPPLAPPLAPPFPPPLAPPPLPPHRTPPHTPPLTSPLTPPHLSPLLPPTVPPIDTLFQPLNPPPALPPPPLGPYPQISPPTRPLTPPTPPPLPAPRPQPPQSPSPTPPLPNSLIAISPAATTTPPALPPAVPTPIMPAVNATPHALPPHVPSPIEMQRDEPSSQGSEIDDTFLDNLIADFVTTPFGAMVERVRGQLTTPPAISNRASTSRTPPPTNEPGNPSEKKKKKHRGKRPNHHMRLDARSRSASPSSQSSRSPSPSPTDDRG